MKKKISKILILTIICTLIMNLMIHPYKAYAFTTNPKIIAGYEYAHALKSDGTIYAWGRNNGSLSCSLLGIGYNSSKEESIYQLNASNVKDVVTASTTTFALLESGTVLMWGANNLSQMGIGGNSASGANYKEGFNAPTAHPYLSGVKRILASNQSTHVFAILNDGSVMRWGYNSSGQQGNGSTATVYMPTNSGLTDVKDIALGINHTLVLKNDGSLYAAGNNASGQLGINSYTNKSSFTSVSTISGVSKVFAGEAHSFAVKSDGSFYAWGRNSNGELGVGATGSKKVPTLVSGINNPSQVAAGPNHVIVLMPDGTVKTAGDNAYGQLGYSGSSDVLSFYTVPGITSAVQVQAGYHYSMVLLADGTIKTFGENDYAQLGLGYSDTNVHSSPSTIPNLSLFQDTIPPVITIGGYNTNPTNQDIIVTASTNEGTLNATSHVFSENGSFEFIATDKAGNVTRKTITITNIDKTAPIITIGNYNTNPTNQDIVVTATTNEGLLNVTSHTYTENGGFTFTATDIAGNITSKTVTVSNIDKVSPIISIEPYSTEPTNKDVIVNASTNEGVLNKTSHTFETNGSFEFIATDEAGNITTKTVTIDNINKIAPVITLGSYNTNPTNEDIIVTASVDKGTLNETSHTFIENGSFEFIATDSLGNTTTKTVIITNIDKNSPSKPMIAVDNNILTILAGMDSESGVKETLYQINNGSWKIYSDTILLADGSYTINAKTVDHAGNESTYDVYTANIYNDAITNAISVIVKAENTYMQADLDKALVLIRALPDSPEKTDLLNRADNLQKLIDGKTPVIITTDPEEVAREQVLNMKVKASNLEDLYTMHLEVGYEPGKLELNQANITYLAGVNNFDGYAAFNLDSSNGKAKIIYSLKGNIPGVNGDYDLISLPFKSLRIGKTKVEVRKISLVNSQGNIIKESTVVISKDINILPNPLNINLTGEKGQNDWYITPVTVEVNDLDAKDIKYLLDGDEYGYTQPFMVEDIGEHKLKVTTDDGNGYIKEKDQTIKIDYTGPAITVNNQSYAWQNEVKVLPKFDDQGGSGVSMSWYQWSNTSDKPEQWEEYNQEELLQATEGNWYLHMKASDVAGNYSQTTFGPYQIDSTMPVISIDNDKREAWEINDISVTPLVSDEGGSQLKYVGYNWSLEQSEPAEYTTYSTGSLEQTGDGAWYLHLITEDWAGNISKKSYGPYNIDKAEPTIEFSDVAEGISFSDSVTPIVNIKDSGSGIKVRAIQLDGEDYVPGTLITERGVHTITAYAEDYTGHITTKSLTFSIYTSTTLTLEIPQVEYSDMYTIKATLTTGSQSVSGSAISTTGSAIAISGAAISIKLDSVDMGIHYTDSQGNIVLNGIASLKAGNYTVDAIYIPNNSDYYGSSQCQATLSVIREKSSTDYTDSYEMTGPGALTVQASIGQENDSNQGDIRIARFRVEILKVNEDNSTTLVEEFDTDCDANGVVAFEKNYNKGTYRIKIELIDEGYYIPVSANIAVLVK